MSKKAWLSDHYTPARARNCPPLVGVFLENIVSTIIQIGYNIGLNKVYNFLNLMHNKQYDVFLIEANKFSIEKCKQKYLIKKEDYYIVATKI